MGEFGLVADDVQQQVNGELTLRLQSAALPERHPSMGTTQGSGIVVPAVTKRQVEPQDRGDLHVVLALVILFRGLFVHLAIQNHPIEIAIAVTD